MFDCSWKEGLEPQYVLCGHTQRAFHVCWYVPVCTWYVGWVCPLVFFALLEVCSQDASLEKRACVCLAALA